MRRVIGVAGIAVPLAALVVFALVVRQNYTLRRQIAAKVTPSKAAVRFVAGDELARLPVFDLNGQRAALDFANVRRTVIVVEPQCQSCAKTMASLVNDGTTTVISVAPPAETRAAAEKRGIAGITYSAALTRGAHVANVKLTAFPQVLLVDRGKIVRTCATPDECRAKS